jgi:hypothetical protein
MRRQLEARERAQASGRPAPRQAWWLLFGGLPAVVAVALILLSVPHRLNGGPDFAGKGAIGLELYVVRGGGTGTFRDGATLRVGDLVQPTWSAERAGYLIVLGRDLRGAVSVVFPEGAAAPAAVEAGHQVALGRSIVATPAMDGYELWSLFSAHAFDVKPLVARLEGGGQPDHFGGVARRTQWHVASP